MKNLGYYNGQFDLLEKMSVPMLDRACYFGDGVYDAAYSANHTIYNLEEHVNRFFNSAAILSIPLPYTKEELINLLNEMVQKVDCGEQFVYWQATRGAEMRSHVFPEGNSNLWIMLTPCKVQDTYQPIRLITLEDTRFFHCNAKTLNLIPNVLAAQKAAEADCEEAVFHRGERVTECAHSNVHIIKDGVFRTAPTDNLILPGIARANLIKTCRIFQIPVEETPFSCTALFDADEVIISSSGSFCVPVSTIDGRPVGGKAPDLLKNLQDTLVKDFIEKTTGHKNASTRA